MNEFNDIITSLDEAIEVEKGKKKAKYRKITVSPIINYNKDDIKKLRLKLKLSQSVFADVLGVSIKTVEAWESGRNMPSGVARRMFEIISKDNCVINQILKIS